MLVHIRLETNGDLIVELKVYLRCLTGPTLTFSITVVLGCLSASEIGMKCPVFASLAFSTVFAISKIFFVSVSHSSSIAAPLFFTGKGDTRKIIFK